MKNLNSILIIAMLLAASFHATAQEPNTIVFTYDDAGNRITREAIYIPPGKDPDKEENTDTTGITNPEIYKTGPIKHSANVGAITINIYPNPNDGMFKVILEGWETETKASLQLHSLLGTEVEKAEELRQETNIDITSQPNGTYLLTITVNGKKETWKLIKR